MLNRYSMAGLILIFLLTGFSLFGQDRTWDYGAGTTAWGTATNWNPDDVPDTNTENVVVDTGIYGGYPDTDTDYTVNNVTLSAAGASLSVSGDTLTVTGYLLVSNGNFTNTGTVTVQGTFTTNGGSFVTSGVLNIQNDFTTSTGTFSNTGTINFDGTTNLTTNGINIGDIIITTGNTVTLQSDLTCNNLTINGTLNTNGYNITVNGTANINAGGILNGGVGAVTFSGDLTNSGTLNMGAGVVTVVGAADFSGGTVDFNGVGNGVLVVEGNVTLNGTSTLSNIDSGDIVRFTGNNAQTVITGGIAFPSIEINKSGGSVGLNTNNMTQVTSGGLSFTCTGATAVNLNGLTWTLESAVDINDNVTFNINTGVLNGGQAVTVSGSGVLNHTGGSLVASSLTKTGTGSVAFGTGDISISGQLEVSGGNVTQTGATAGTQTAGNILVDGGTLTLDSGSFVLSGSVAVSSGSLNLGSKVLTGVTAFTVNGSGSVDFGSSDVSISGNLTVDTTGATADTAGIVRMSGAGTTIDIGAGDTICDLEIGANVTVAVSGASPDVDVLTFSGGSLAVGGNDFQANSAVISQAVTVGAGGAFSTVGSMDINTGGSVVASGSGAVTAGNVLTVNGTGAVSVVDGALTVSAGGMSLNGSGAINSTGTGDIVVTGNLSWVGSSSDMTLSGGGQLQVSGDITEDGTSTGAIDSGAGGINVTGSLTQSAAGNGNISAGAGGITIGGQLTNYAVMSITSGNLSVNGAGGNSNSGTIQTVTSGTQSYSGNMTNSGTITGVGAVTFSGDLTNSGTLNGGGGQITIAGNLDLTGGTFNRNTSAVTVGGDFLSGTFNKGITPTPMLTFNGGAQNVTCTSDLGRVTINAGSTVNIQDITVTMDDLTINGSLNLRSSGLATTLQINNNSTITNNGTFSVPLATGTVTLLGLGGNVHFINNDINITTSLTMSNIKYDTAMSLAAGEILTLGDSNCSFTDITIGNGAVFNANGNDFIVSGNWDNSGTGSFNNPATVTFASTAAQTLNSGGTGVGKQFNNISHTGTGTLSLIVNPLQINGNLSNTSGTFALNNQNITVNGSLTSSSVLSASGSETLTLRGNVNISGTFNQATSKVYFDNSASNLSISTGAGIELYDVYIDVPGGGTPVTVTLNDDLVCHQFVLYGGNVDLNTQELSTDGTNKGDVVLLGNSLGVLYNYEDDHDTAAIDTDFQYPYQATLLFDPGAGNYDGTFSDLVNSTISVGRNFYVNGSDLTGSANWTLNLQDNSSSTPPWGNPFAVAFNMTVQNSTAGVGWVSAAEPVTGGAEQVNGENETNNNVFNGGGNTNWDFTRPRILSAETVYDNVIHITFSKKIENDNGEIAAAVNQIFLDNGVTPFSGGAFSDAECTVPLPNGDVDNFYIKAQTFPIPVTWNTDADGGLGGAGKGSGDANSTDRSGVHQTVVPDISILKGILFGEHKNRIRNYNNNGFAVFDGTTDKCRPVLYKVEAGQAAHEPDPVGNSANYFNYDGRNYFHLFYSEPVTIGNLTTTGALSTNVRSQTSFGAGEHGGDISGSGTVNVEGFFTYPGTVNRDSTDGTATASALYRSGTPAITNSDYEVAIYLQGYSTGASPNFDWPGYVWGVTDPNGQTVTVVSNPNITDANGNAIEPTVNDTSANTYAKPVVTIAASTTAGDVASWDVDPPTIATYLSGTPTYYEVVSRDTTGSGLIDRLEFHILDDSSSDPAWDPATDHPDLPGNSNGIRDATLDNPSAFKIEEVGITPLTNTYNISFVSDVNNSLFTSVNVKDDPYFTLTLADSGYSWGLLSELYLTYDSNTGHITDLAGNLLASISTPIRCIERVPPKISYSLAVVDEKKVYAKFSEPVYGDDGTAGPPRATISASDFTFIGDNSIASIELLDKASDNGVSEVIFTLAKALTPDTEATGMIEPKVASVFDKPGNEMPVSNRHRVTDIGLGVVEPVWASDGIHSDALHGGASGALRDFDGTGRLMDRDITLEISILADTQRNASTKLYYDVSPDTSYIADGIWLPSLIQGFIPKANTEARGVTPFRAQGAVRDFLIPGSDEEIVDGANLEFILKVGNLFCARATEQTDSSSNIPWLIQPWIIPIRDIVRQKAGVTILNNVIDPTKGDKTIINYTITKTGLVTVQVFDLSGDIVQVLHRGRQVKGEYSFAWDGRNRGGRVVARGVYFIRVVGPGIDEMRKVLVVK